MTVINPASTDSVGDAPTRASSDDLKPGQTFAAYIVRELESERERRKTLDARGVFVVLVSAGFATLLTAAGVLVSGQTGFELPENAVAPLTLALVAFAAAGGCGMAAAYLWRYNVPAFHSLSSMVSDKWTTNEVDARKVAATLDLAAIRSLRERNAWKARWLIAALWCHLAGLLALAATVFRIFQGD